MGRLEIDEISAVMGAVSRPVPDLHAARKVVGGVQVYTASIDWVAILCWIGWFFGSVTRGNLCQVRVGRQHEGHLAQGKSVVRTHEGRIVEMTDIPAHHEGCREQTTR